MKYEKEILLSRIKREKMRKKKVLRKKNNVTGNGRILVKDEKKDDRWE